MDNSHTGEVDASNNIFSDPQLPNVGSMPSGVIQHGDGSFDFSKLAGFVPLAGSPAAGAGINVDALIPNDVKAKFPITHDFAGKPINTNRPTIGAFEAASSVTNVDKGALERLIAQALDVKRTNRYLLAGTTKKHLFDQALNTAQQVFNNPYVNQNQIDHSVAELQTTMKGLDGKDVKKHAPTEVVVKKQSVAGDKRIKKSDEEQRLPKTGEQTASFLPSVSILAVMGIVSGSLYSRFIKTK